MNQMPFNDMHVAENGVTWIGFQTVKFCRVCWLVDGEHTFETVCYDADEMANAVNNRTKLTEGLQFEIEYMVGDIRCEQDS